MSSLDESSGSASPFAAGTSFAGKFEIRGVLGEGGMGRIYDAWHVSIGRRVAIKVLREGTMHAPGARERFRHEALALAQLQHPNIVTLHDADVTEEGLAYLVLEYLSGRPLSAERGCALELGRAVRIVQQICRALAAAHAAGIVHRDLKTSNVHLIQLDEPDFVKLLDFGIAKSLPREKGGGTRLTSVDQRVGTLRYMAPEQIRDDAVDHRADLYALGCLLFEVLSGAPPFAGKIGPKLVEQHLTHPPPRFHDVRPELSIDAELEVIARTLMQKRREDRFQSAVEVEAALADAGARAR